MQRGADALAAFGDRLVAEADHGKADDAAGDMDLHIDRPRLDALKGHRLDMRDHVSAPCP